jgi:hypothetical protein
MPESPRSRSPKKEKKKKKRKKKEKEKKKPPDLFTKRVYNQANLDANQIRYRGERGDVRFFE